MNNPVLLLASGGLDSTTVAYWLTSRSFSVIPIFFDYGQHCAETEWNTLNSVLPQELVATPERIDLRPIFAGSNSRMIVEPDLRTEVVKDDDLYIPYRTMFFLSAAASIAQSRQLDSVFSGFINSNHAKEIDCTARFLNNMEQLAVEVGQVRFHMPFRDWSKEDVVAEAVRLSVPLGKTYSCQLLSDTACGACPNCVERLRALAAFERRA